ncbi:MAG: GGDEF domain-containing protein [bacterium]|nr:GGDEF domain-containing protein [bacterium]
MFMVNIIKESLLILSIKEVLSSTLSVICSGDKFNAITEALGAILNFIRIRENTVIHLVYVENGYSTDFLFHNFKLPAKVENNKLSLTLGSDNEGIEHFESDHVPFADICRESEVKYPSYLIINGVFYFFIWHQQELIAAAKVEDIECDLIDPELAEMIEAIAQFLSFSLQNLNNDFKLLILKKQLEKQQQEIIEDKRTIERQNKILRSLMEAMTRLDKADLEDVFNYCLMQLKGLFPEMGFGLIIDGEREGIVQWACFIGISDIDQELAVDASSHLKGPATLEFLPGGAANDKAGLFWSVLPMKGQQKRVIGKLLIKGCELQTESKDIISLFLDQLSAYTENKLLIGELERIANTDGLTGTFNRSYFTRELERIIQNAERFQKLHFSIFLIDLNGLKRVNDQYGHQQGDNMIIKAGEVLLKMCRKSDIVCRFGGDEYVVLCPSTNFDQASILKERLRKQEQETFLSCEDSQGNTELIPIRISIGLCSSSEGIVPDKVLETADKRMYQDKTSFYESNSRYR